MPTRSVFRSDPPSRPGPFPPATPETQEDSGNAAANGNFSIQVLTKALEVWNLTCVPATSQAAGSAWREPQRESSFLCNLDQHWFTVRRCDARSPTVHASAAGTSTDAASASASAWWNFNSMFPAPQPISELYLSAFLAQLKDEGYSIFVVRGVAPRVDANAAPGPAGEYGRWITPEEAATLNKQAETIKNAGRARNAAEQALARVGAGGSAVLRVAGNVAGSVFGAGAGDPSGGEEDAELQAAIAASLGTTGPGTGTGTGMTAGMTPGTISGTSLGTGSASDDDLARALAASLAGAAPPAPPPRDDDLAAAIAASLADSVPSPSPSPLSPLSPLSPFPVARGGLDGYGADAAAPSEVASVPEEPGPADPEALTLAFRAPDGSRLRRRFLRGDSVGAAAAYVAAATGTDMSRHRLTLAFPRRQLSDASATLHEAGVKDKETLSVEPARD